VLSNGHLNLNKNTNMKTEALSYALITVAIAGAVGLLVAAVANYGVGSVIGWAAAGVLLAMTAIESRRVGKSLLGRS
jgi:hypothetical protein